MSTTVLDSQQLLSGNGILQIPTEQQDASYLAYAVQHQVDQGEFKQRLQHLDLECYQAEVKEHTSILLMPTMKINHHQIQAKFENYRKRLGITRHNSLQGYNFDLSKLEKFTYYGGFANPEKAKHNFQKVIQNSQFRQKYKNDDRFKLNALEGLAKSQKDYIYNDVTVKWFIKELNKIAKDSQQYFDSAKQQLSQSFETYLKTYHFKHYLNQFRDQTIKTLGQLLISRLDDEFTPDSKLKLDIVAQTITRNFTPYLLNAEGDDLNNLVIYDPLQGFWVHDPDIFMRLLQAMRPASGKQDNEKIMLTMAANAANENHYIDPYSASRHWLFNNGVLDLKTKEFIPLKDPRVKQLHFTERAKLNIDYDPSITTAPSFEGQSTNHQAWNVEKFINAYGNNEPDKINFLLFLLSFGLFGSHNFGVHVSIKGTSGWGKTSLKIIYDRLYNHHTMAVAWSDLNKPFPFSGYRQRTPLIWINECNTDGTPLGTETGVTTYDTLADRTAIINNKGRDNIIIRNPPQVYIDGTSYIKAENMATGPLRRTLVFQLPNNNALRDQIQANQIEEVLGNVKTIQYLINRMRDAYTSALNFPDETTKNKLWNLEINLGDQSPMLNFLPEFERNWRREFMQEQGQLQSWYNEEFIKFVTISSSNNTQAPTIMHDYLAYKLYEASYENKYGLYDKNKLTREAFSLQFHSLLKTSNLKRIPYNPQDGCIISNFAATNFNVDQFNNEGYITPPAFQEDNGNKRGKTSSYPLGTKDHDWYIIAQE